MNGTPDTAPTQALVWQRLGRIFSTEMVKGHPWINSHTQSPAAVVLDDRIRIYFCARAKPESPGMFLSRLLYVDVQLSDPSKVLHVAEEPVASLGQLGTFDEFGMNPVSAIQFEGAVRLYYAGWTRCVSVPFNSATGVVESRDGGHHFERLGDGPILGYSIDEPFTLGSPRVKRFGDRWFLWYAAGKEWIASSERPEPIYKIRMAYSDDGLNWHRVGRDLISDRLDEKECQASAEVFFSDGRFNMLFSFRASTDYKTGIGQYRIGYAYSTDLLHWTRDDDMAGIAPIGAGWEGQSVSYPNVFVANGHTYMLYQGDGMGDTGFGLAKLSQTSRDR